MKKNGFTLVELIATLLLMSLLATVILINMVGVKEDQDQKSIETFHKQVEEAACTYIDLKEQVALRESCKANSNQDKCKIKVGVLLGGKYTPTFVDDVENGVVLLDVTTIDKETNQFLILEPDDIYVQVKWVADGSHVRKVCEFHRK